MRALTRRRAVDRATIIGTIAGWDALPAPAADQRSIVGTFNVATNLRVRNPAADCCFWWLRVPAPSREPGLRRRAHEKLTGLSSDEITFTL